MSFEALFEVFDAWEVLLKARKPKGLAKWNKLAGIADNLSGKKASDITFTTCYPGSEGQKKILGSVEGNLHFLMGYANPAFHIASYHYQIVDVNLSPLDAEVLYRTKGHPSRPELWERSGMKMKEEGDLIEGNPHPSVANVMAMEKLKAARKAESITVESGVGSYTAIPSEGIVYGNHNKQVYAWEMVRDSFLAAANPELTQAMNEAAQARLDLDLQIAEGSQVPELVKHVANKYYEEPFAEDVYPLVKSHYPLPSSIVPVETTTGELVYGVVTPTSIDFYNREGCEASINLYDSTVKSFDLTKDGNTYSSVVLGFGKSYLNVPEDLEELTKSNTKEISLAALRGNPTYGLEEIGSDYKDVVSLNKSVVEDGGAYRLVVHE